MAKVAPNALVLSGQGFNCELETAHALKIAGSNPELIHINKLLEKPDLLEQFPMVVIPGGFSFGDDLGSGKVVALLLQHKIQKELERFVERGGFLLGICNGFQVLVKSGLLPFIGSEAKLSATLTTNDPMGFVNKWIKLDVDSQSKCIWTKGMKSLELPIRHGEGRFILENPDNLLKLKESGSVVLRYTKPVNGSLDRIAGICDGGGRVFGLMPHPEAFVRWSAHPHWSRLRSQELAEPPGIRIFKNAVEYIFEKGAFS